MKKALIFIFISLLFLSCKTSIEEKEIVKEQTPPVKQEEENKEDTTPPKEQEEDNKENIDYKSLIKEHTPLIKNGGYPSFISSEYEYSKPNVDFNIKDYRLIVSKDKPLTIYLENENKEKEVNVSYFVDSRVYTSPDLILFSEEETQQNNGMNVNTSPLILDEKNGSVTLKGNPIFTSSDFQLDGVLIAVVDGKYVHKKPFTVLNKTDEENLLMHKKTEERVKELTLPLMKYSDVEKAFLMNKTVCDNLVYDEGFYGRPNDYNTFVLGLAVCQGYSWMNVRLGEEIGINIKDLHGQTGLGKHAWNAVCIEGEYYYIDSTWNDEDDSLLDFFFTPKEIFEENPVFNPLNTHEKRMEGKPFGTKYLNTENKYGQTFNEYKTHFTSFPPVPENKIPLPDISKVNFVGKSCNTANLQTTEENIEYTTGDGFWYPLPINEVVEIKGIKKVNKSIFTPRVDNQNYIGSPLFILLRRREGSEWSNYVKLTIYKNNESPSWIKEEKGRVTLINTKMEYKKEGDVNYSDVTENEMTLPMGHYEFRFKGKDNYFASDSYVLEVKG